MKREECQIYLHCYIIYDYLSFNFTYKYRSISIQMCFKPKCLAVLMKHLTKQNTTEQNLMSNYCKGKQLYFKL